MTKKSLTRHWDLATEGKDYAVYGVVVNGKYKPLSREEWLAEYQHNYEPTDLDKKVYQLAETYENNCEAFDRTVCPLVEHGRFKGEYMPVTPSQMGAIQRYAESEWSKVMTALISLAKEYDVEFNFLVVKYRAFLDEVQRKMK